MAIFYTFEEYADSDVESFKRRLIEIRDRDKDTFRQIMEVLNNLYDDGNLTVNGTINAANLKSGANQAAAGAAAGEMWVDTSDNSIKLGV